MQLESGYLQFRYNLGSGEAIAMVTGSKFGDGGHHEVEVRRDGRTAVVWVDDRYVARVTAPGLDTLLDVDPSAIFLGASISASGGTVENGFGGCLNGATLDGKLLPLSGSNEDFEVSYSGLDTPTFGCRVPPTGGVTTAAPTLPYLYIIVIVSVVALLLLVVIFIVTVVTVQICRKRCKRTGTSLYEMRSEDFVLSEAFRPREIAEYREEEQGFTRNSAGNIRSYDSEGGGESDIGNGAQLDLNSIVTQTASTDELLRTEGSMFSTFSSGENRSNARATRPAQVSPMLNSRPSREAAEGRIPERYVTQTQTTVSNIGAMAESPPVRPREPPLATGAAAAAARPKPVNAPVPPPKPHLATGAAAAAKPKPVNVDVPVPRPKPPLATGAAAAAARPKPVNAPVPPPKPHLATGAAAAAKPKPVNVDVPQPRPHPNAKSHLSALGKQILKRKAAADAEVLQDDYDETTTFQEEGNLTPLSNASLRSLYRMQDEEDDTAIPNITGPSAPRFSHLLSLLEQLNVTDDDVSSTCTADTIDAIRPKVADQSHHQTPPPVPVKKHKSRFPATTVSVRQV